MTDKVFATSERKSVIANVLFIRLQTVLLFLKFFEMKGIYLWFAGYFQSNYEN